MTSVAILAGGFGTRLQSVISDRPKVLAPVAGRRFLAYLLDQIADSGFEEVVLCTGYLGEQVRMAFGQRFRKLKLAYSQERHPLGTGGALRNALPFFEDNTVLVLNGDSYCDVDLAAFLRWHGVHRAETSLVLAKTPDVSRYGAVASDSRGRIIRFSEKGASGPGWINAGIYALSTDAIASIPPAHAVSLEHECFPRWAAKGLFGFRAQGRFLDIGTPESIRSAAAFFSRTQFRENDTRRAIFLDRDGTVIAERDYLSDPAGLELLPGATSALASLRQLGFRLVLITNQSGIGRGLFNESRLEQIHDRLREVLGNDDVALDAIYYCPHLPDAQCDCRKPHSGLVMRAVEDLNIDPHLSFVVGDKACDIELGKRVGATTILVRTGYGNAALSAGIKADFTVENILAVPAVIGRHIKALPGASQLLFR